MSDEKTTTISDWFKKRKRLLIGISTVVLIILMIFYVDFPSLIQKIITIGYWGLFLFIITYTITFLFRAYKSKLIFKGIGQEISYSTSFFSTGSCLVINDMTPGKIGDIVRIFIIKDQENIRLSESVAGVAIERILDLIILFIISCSALLFLFMSNYGETSTKIILGQNIQFFLVLGLTLIIGILVALMLLIYKTEFVMNTIKKIFPKIAEYTNKFITNFKEGMKKFKDHKKAFVLVVLLGFLTWIIDAFIVVIFFYFLGYQLNILLLILATFLINFSKTFPITPGGWGLSENIGALFIFFFYDPVILYTDILAIFIIDHLVRSVYLLFYGGYSIFHYNLKLREIKQIKQIKN